MKKKWKKPELVVLVRSRPEESVLNICKTGGVTNPSDASAEHQGCRYNTADCTFCAGAKDS